MDKKFLNVIEDKLEEDDQNELSFDGIRIEKLTPEMREQIEQFKGLNLISFNDCGLVSLENLPKLESIIRVELMNNQFPVSHLKYLQCYPNLECVSLSNCNIKTIDDVKSLSKIDSLVQLDFSGTEFSHSENYRKEVFDTFENLVILDDKNKDGVSFEYSDSNEFDDEDLQSLDKESDDNDENDDYGDDSQDGKVSDHKQKNNKDSNKDEDDDDDDDEDFDEDEEDNQDDEDDEEDEEDDYGDDNNEENNNDDESDIEDDDEIDEDKWEGDDSESDNEDLKQYED